MEISTLQAPSGNRRPYFHAMHGTTTANVLEGRDATHWHEITCTLCNGAKKVASAFGGAAITTCGRCHGYGVLFKHSSAFTASELS